MQIESVEDAVRDEDWPAARKRMAIKLARMLDGTDSARDVKSISLSLAPLLNECDADSKKADDDNTTPLASILAEAERVIADAR